MPWSAEIADGHKTEMKAAMSRRLATGANGWMGKSAWSVGRYGQESGRNRGTVKKCVIKAHGIREPLLS